jgi:hypothetical protein
MRHPDVTDEQLELIKDTIEIIKRHEGNFNMNNFINVLAHEDECDRDNIADLFELPLDEEQLHVCNTTMCFAGWLIYTKNKQLVAEGAGYPKTELSSDFEALALAALGFDKDDINSTIFGPRVRPPTLGRQISDVFFMTEEITTVEQLEDQLVKLGLYEKE